MLAKTGGGAPTAVQRMSQENVKKAGYLSKLPVKGLVKVSPPPLVTEFYNLIIVKGWS